MNQSNKASKRQARREQLRRKENQGRTIGLGLIIVGALFIAFLIIWPNFKPVASITQLEPNKRFQADANHQGDPNAPVQLTEFADFQCPFCEHFFTDTEKSIEDAYVKTGKLYFTYRSAGNWVSGNIGGGKTESQDAAQAAYCAGDQNLYWEMHDMLYSNTIGEDAGSFTDRRLASIAEKTGLDMTKFNSCYSSNKYKDQVSKDYTDAIAAKIQGTPFFVLTYKDASGKEITKTVDGAQPFSAFQQLIDAALAGK